MDKAVKLHLAEAAAAAAVAVASFIFAIANFNAGIPSDAVTRMFTWGLGAGFVVLALVVYDAAPTKRYSISNLAYKCICGAALAYAIFRLSALDAKAGEAFETAIGIVVTTSVARLFAFLIARYR
ncbi:MAG TPA: hypothetical protein VMV50_03730 [Candidatus Paceibacterota bacterium]|nr:hypothetical protein [Candidatus Paceibacterota bacterium]